MEEFIARLNQAGVRYVVIGGQGVVSFDVAESSAVEMPLENGTPCRVLSAADLLQTKLAAGRNQDQLDIEFLKEKQRH